MNAQKSVEKSKAAAGVSAQYRSRNGRTYVYTPGSLWSHLKYGLGTLSIIVIPPLIPGIKSQWLIMGYMGALVAVLGIVCVWGMVRSLYPPQARRGMRYARHQG